MSEILLFGLNQEKSLDGIISQNEECEFPGLNHLSEYLLRAGIENGVYDNIYLESLPTLIKSNSPKIVGFSVFGTNYPASIKAAQIVKDISPKTITVFGGPLASNYPQIDGSINVIVVGEGEKTFLDLSQRVLNGRGIEDVRGTINISRRDIRKNELRERLTNQELDSVNVRNLHRTLSPHYRKHIPHSMPFNQMMYGLVIGSRGCTNHCDFCDNETIWHRKVSIRSPENVVDEIEFLSQQGVNYIGFMDTDFLMNNLICPAWTENVAQGIIDRRIKVKYHAMSSVKSAVRFESFDLLRKSGCAEISLGMESTDSNVTEAIGKNFSLFELKTALDKIYSARIYPSLYVLFGHPNESEKGLNEQYDILKGLNWCRLRAGFVLPYPGTRLYHRVESEDLWINGYKNRFDLMSGDKPVIKTVVSPQRLIKQRKRLLKLYLSNEYFERFAKITNDDGNSTRANKEFLEWLKPRLN